MPLNSILTITDALLHGSGERLAEGSAEANAEALLPFAAVLSGTLSLLTPDQATPEAGAEQHLVPEEGVGENTASENKASEALIQHLGLVALDPSDNTGPSLEPAPSSTLLPAVDEGHEGNRPGNMPTLDVPNQRQALEGVAFQNQPTAADLAGTLDAAQQAVTGETSQTASAMLEAEGQAGNQILDTSKEEGSEGAEAEETASSRRSTARAATRLDAGKKMEALAHAAEQNARPGVPESKETPATGMTTTEAASAALDVDAALPDLEGTPSEKTTETAGSSREKATATDIDGGGVSADAGGDSDSKKDGTRRARRTRRTEAEPAALRKVEQSAVEQARLQETAAPQTDATLETTPELADTENTALPDLDPSLAPTEEHVALAASEKSTADAPTGRARAARGLFQQNRAVPVAWLRAVLNNARQSAFSEDGWKVLEMNLDEGDGTVTIKARREEGRVAVAVGFSDPELRALASTHAERLQEVLQAEYDTAVDFSLFSGNTGDSGGQHQSEGSGHAGAATGHADAADIHDGYPAGRSLPAGTLHEWVG